MGPGRRPHPTPARVGPLNPNELAGGARNSFKGPARAWPPLAHTLAPLRLALHPFPVSTGAGAEAGGAPGRAGGAVPTQGWGCSFLVPAIPSPSPARPPAQPAPGSSPAGADDTRTSLSCVAPQLSANTELPGAVLILAERMHSL